MYDMVPHDEGTLLINVAAMLTCLIVGLCLAMKEERSESKVECKKCVYKSTAPNGCVLGCATYKKRRLFEKCSKSECPFTSLLALMD